MKVIRILLLTLQGAREMKRLVHPACCLYHQGWRVSIATKSRGCGLGLFLCVRIGFCGLYVGSYCYGDG